MTKALIIFSTRSGKTKKIEEILSDCFIETGFDVTIKNANDIKSENDMEGYDIFLLGLQHTMVK